jgi:hypothetical protein
VADVTVVSVHTNASTTTTWTFSAAMTDDGGIDPAFVCDTVDGPDVPIGFIATGDPKVWHLEYNAEVPAGGTWSVPDAPTTFHPVAGVFIVPETGTIAP